jgi:hypothetical protein
LVVYILKQKYLISYLFNASDIFSRSARIDSNAPAIWFKLLELVLNASVATDTEAEAGADVPPGPVQVMLADVLE